MNSNQFILKDKKYNYLDFISIPFSICPKTMLVKIIYSIINAFIPAISVYITANFVDSVIAYFSGNEKERFISQLFMLIGIVAFQYLNKYFIQYFNKRFELEMTKSINVGIIEKKSKLHYMYIENSESWNLLSRISREPHLKFINGYNNAINLLNLVINVGSLMIVLSTKVVWAGILVLFLSVPLTFVAVKAGKKTYDANKSVEEHRRKYLYYQDVLRSRENIEERTIFNFFDKINKEWNNKYQTALKVVLKTEMKNYFLTKSSGLIMAMLSIIICAILLIPLKNNEISIGVFMSLIAAFFNLVNVIVWELIEIMKELSSGKEFLKDLESFKNMDEVNESESLDESRAFSFESLQFKDVSFAYPGTDRYILKNFNLMIEKDKHYAFVGINGSGKTTITKLMLKMYTNYTGEILINGKELKTYKLEDIRNIFSVVFQDYGKYYISFKENIIIGQNDNFEEERFWDCINNINLNSVIAKLPNGIYNQLGKIKEEGVDISGGEWQKIVIGRSLYSKAPIRIFDEPTSALDPIIESKIYSLFDKLCNGKTTIFITHRLGAAKIADTIVVIDNGKVKEIGSHEELIKMNGIYADMFLSQKGWYENEKKQ